MAGVQPNTTAMYGRHQGAEPQSASDPLFRGEALLMPRPLTFPQPPALSIPEEGMTVGQLRPEISGTAEPSAIVVILVDGEELGLTQSAVDGTFSFLPGIDLAKGQRIVEAAVEREGLRSAKSAPRLLHINPLPPLDLDVACGCGRGENPALLGIAGLALVAFARRRRSGLSG